MRGRRTVHSEDLRAPTKLGIFTRWTTCGEPGRAGVRQPRSCGLRDDEVRLTVARARPRSGGTRHLVHARLPGLRSCMAEGYAPGVTTSTICGIIFPVMRSHEILMLVTRP